MASTASLLRSPLPRRRFAACLSTLEASQSSGGATSAGTSCATAKPPSPPPHPPPAARPDSAGKSWADHPDYRRWKDKEEEILKDIEPITLLTKDILHSGRYMDGECLCPDDGKEVVEKLLDYHPRSEDKIGCGLASVMVDRHPTFRISRCLFAVQTDSGWDRFPISELSLSIHSREISVACREVH